MRDKKDIQLGVTEEAEVGLEEIEAYLIDQAKPAKEWSRLRKLILVLVALAIAVAVALLFESNDDSATEGAVTLAQEVVVTTVPTSIEEQVLTSVSPPAKPDTAINTVRVPIVASGDVATETEPEPVAVEVSPETVEVPVAIVSVVDQTQVEMRPVEVPDGVTFNQFEAMEQTMSRPQVEQTTPRPSIEQSTLVAAPIAATSTYSSGFSQAPIPSFSGVASDYLPVETQFLSKSNGLVRAMSMFIVSAALFDLYDDHTASGEARYTVDVGQSSMHGETITLGLYIPRVADVRNVTSDKSGVDKTWLRSQLISAACQDVGNIRTVMDQTRNELAAEANGYELTLNWYTQKGGKYVPRDVSDEELISYCQLG